MEQFPYGRSHYRHPGDLLYRGLHTAVVFSFHPKSLPHYKTLIRTFRLKHLTIYLWYE